MRIKRITEVEPLPSRCITVDSPDRLFVAGGKEGDALVSHNSVAQRNIIISCIMRPEHWRFIGIDMKRVELSEYRRFSHVVLGVATDLEDALLMMRFAQQTMMKRYTQMEALNYKDFKDLPEKSQSLLVMIDEMTELVSASGAKALSGDTELYSPDGMILMKNVQPGTVLYDDSWRETTVLRKYVAGTQNHYDVNIVDVDSGESEVFDSGAEHWWEVYYEYPGGVKVGPDLVTSEMLSDILAQKDTLPEERRFKVLIQRNDS